MRSVAGLGALLRSGAETSVSLTRRALDAARCGDSGAFVELAPEQALEAADRADRERAEGVDRGPLHGIPLAVKDNIDVAGCWTRMGTAAFGHRRAERDASVIARLRALNAVVLGKTRTHEMAWGMVTPECRNPLEHSRMTGGSSGGSSAAVAEGIVPVALGTDTGGSVRNPAALCGVAGIKTEVRRLPMDGVAPMAATQDTIGVLGTSIADCRTTLTCLGMDVSSAWTPRRVGVIADSWAQRVEPEVSRAVTEATRRLTAHEVSVDEVSVRHAELAPVAAYVIMLVEAADNWWPGEGELPTGAVSPAIREQLRLGSVVTERDYTRALEVREAIERGVRDALREVDVLMLASCPVLAAPHGAEVVDCAGRRVPVAAAHSALTSLASVSGLPALSVPGTPAGNGLATGIQLIGTDTGSLCRHAELLENRPSTPASSAAG